MKGLNGWTKLSRADGTLFASQDACVSYGANGGKFGQTINFTSTNPSPVKVGASYTPTATATSGLQPVITLDAKSTGCSLSLAGVVSFTSAGPCLIDANQDGNGTWAPAPQAQQSVALQPEVTVINPGSRRQVVFESVNLQISATGPDGDVLTFSAFDLPPGTSINKDTGLISGTLTTAGDYHVSVHVDDGAGHFADAIFDWQVRSPSP